MKLKRFSTAMIAYFEEVFRIQNKVEIVFKLPEAVGGCNVRTLACVVL